MPFERLGARIEVDIPITITTVLDSLEARIIDLSEHGAQVVGCGVSAGTRFHIEYKGQTVYAQCRWAEVDRMGVKFSFPLTEGPLHELLLTARAVQFPADIPEKSPMPYAPSLPRSTGPAHRSFGRRIG